MPKKKQPAPSSQSPSAMPACNSNITTPGCDPCVKTKVVVEFRPHDQYVGEFGFDWLRMKEAPTVEAAYQDAILQGYKSTQKNAIQLNNVDAYHKLTTEYEKWHITRHQPTQYRDLTYYVPYLNLFPKTLIPSLTPQLFHVNETDKSPSPRCQAKLRLIIDVKSCAPERIVIECPKGLTINGESCYELPNVQGNYDVTDDNIGTSKNVKNRQGEQEVITICCEDVLHKDCYIDVFAYPIGTAEKSAAHQNAAKQLAGRLKVLKNNKIKKQPVLFVSTSITENSDATKKVILEGKLTFNEVKRFYKAFYQSLSFPVLTNKKLSHHSEELVLDLTNDPFFQTSHYTAEIKKNIRILNKDYKNVKIESIHSSSTLQEFEQCNNAMADLQARAKALFVTVAEAINQVKLRNGLTADEKKITDPVISACHKAYQHAEKLLQDMDNALNDLAHYLTQSPFSSAKAASLSKKIAEKLFTIWQEYEKTIYYGRYRNREGMDRFAILNTYPRLDHYLVKVFHQQYPTSSDQMLIFRFEQVCKIMSGTEVTGYVLGNVHSKNGEFIKGVTLFKQQNAFTLSHEALHGLGLRHTHSDDEQGLLTNTNKNAHPDAKYLFHHPDPRRTVDYDPDKATDNILSYSRKRYITWQWQWNILRKAIKNTEHVK